MKNAAGMFLFVFLLIIGLGGCASNGENNITKEAESIVNKYYDMEDFDAIKVGESTFYDVCEIVPASKIAVTSYGGLCQYPMNDGRFINIKFYGPQLTVGSITICEA